MKFISILFVMAVFSTGCAHRSLNADFLVPSTASEPPQNASVPKKNEREVASSDPAAELAEFCSIKFVRDGIGHYCSGSYYEPGIILTAAHCLNDQMGKRKAPSPQELEVNCGVNLDSKLTVERTLPNPNYVNNWTETKFDWQVGNSILKRNTKFQQIENDVGLIFVNPDELQSEYRRKLDPKRALTISASDSVIETLIKGDCFSYGIGQSMRTQRNPKQTRTSLKPLNSESALVRLKIFNPIGILTASGEAAPGNSGGPLICLDENKRNVQVGVTSHGEKRFTSYEKTSNVGSWLKENSLKPNGDVVPPVKPPVLVKFFPEGIMIPKKWVRGPSDMSPERMVEHLFKDYPKDDNGFGGFLKGQQCAEDHAEAKLILATKKHSFREFANYNAAVLAVAGVCKGIGACKLNWREAPIPAGWAIQGNTAFLELYVAGKKKGKSFEGGYTSGKPMDHLRKALASGECDTETPVVFSIFGEEPLAETEVKSSISFTPIE